MRRVTGPRREGHPPRRLGPALAALDPGRPQARGPDLAPWDSPDRGPLALPGTYTVTLARRSWTADHHSCRPRAVRVMPLELATLPAADREAALAFHARVARLQRAVHGAIEAADEAGDPDRPPPPGAPRHPGRRPGADGPRPQLTARLDDIVVALRGDRTRTSATSSPRRRSGSGSNGSPTTSGTPPPADPDAPASLRLGGRGVCGPLERLRTLVDTELDALEDELEAAGGPWTPGRRGPPLVAGVDGPRRGAPPGAPATCP